MSPGRSDIEAIATQAGEAAAHQAVRDTFRLFGVDTEDQDQINSFRADLIWARSERREAERRELERHKLPLKVLGAIIIAGLGAAASDVGHYVAHIFHLISQR